MHNKKLVGIVSYNIYSQHMNYGAALHSYAFQQYLLNNGVESVIIAYKPKELNNYNLKYPILIGLKHSSILLVAFSIGDWECFQIYENIISSNCFLRPIQQ